MSLLRLCAEICTGNNAASAATVSKAFPYEAILLFLEVGAGVTVEGVSAPNQLLRALPSAAVPLFVTYRRKIRHRLWASSLFLASPPLPSPPAVD